MIPKQIHGTILYILLYHSYLTVWYL